MDYNTCLQTVFSENERRAADARAENQRRGDDRRYGNEKCRDYAEPVSEVLTGSDKWGADEKDRREKLVIYIIAGETICDKETTVVQPQLLNVQVTCGAPPNS